MSNIRRVSFIVVTVVATLVVGVKVVQAAWHAPMGYYWWGAPETFCENGGKIVIRHSVDHPDDIDSLEDFPKTMHFHAHHTTIDGPLVPEVMDDAPIKNPPIARASVRAGYFPGNPLPYTYNGTSGTAEVYGVVIVPWHLEEGTTVAIKRNNGIIVGKIDACKY